MWPNLESTRGQTEKHHLAKHGDDPWVNKKWHVDKQENYTWANLERTCGQIGTEHVAEPG